MFLKRSEESYSNVRFNGEKVDFDSFEWDYLLYQLGKMGVCLIKYVYTINEILINKMKKIALISGITGQDGSFLAEFLIE